MRKPKEIIRAGAGILALLAVAVFLLGRYLDRAATLAANEWLSSSFTVPAGVEKVRVRLLSGKFEATGLRIANPNGFAHREFLTLKKGEMDVRIPSLWTGEIVAESLRGEGLIVRLEKIDGRQNAREIFPAGSRKDAKETGGKRFRIRRMALRNALLTFPVSGGEQVATVERLEVEEPLGKGRSAPLREVIAQVVARTVREGAGQSVERAFAGSLSAVRDGAGQPGRAGNSAGDGKKRIFKGSGR
ncbi:MAG: hypothetical protein HW377_1988 [Actinobacteria bacterium]|nr:hypothetical protein [Actinomycetota bacterium]